MSDKIDPTRLSALLRYRSDLMSWIGTDFACRDEDGPYDCVIIGEVNAGLVREELRGEGSRWEWDGALLMPTDYFVALLSAQLRLVNSELKRNGIKVAQPSKGEKK